VSGFNAPKNLVLNRLIFHGVVQKEKGGRFGGHGVYTTVQERVVVQKKGDRQQSGLSKTAKRLNRLTE